MIMKKPLDQGPAFSGNNENNLTNYLEIHNPSDAYELKIEKHHIV